MVRHDQDVRAQQCGIATDQISLGPRFDVPGKQGAPLSVAHTDDARKIVWPELGVGVIRFDGMNDREIDTVPRPSFAGDTALCRLAAKRARPDDGIFRWE